MQNPGGYYIVPKYIQDFISFAKKDDTIPITEEQMREFVDLANSGKFGVMNYAAGESIENTPIIKVTAYVYSGTYLLGKAMLMLFGAKVIGAVLHQDNDKLVKLEFTP